MNERQPATASLRVTLIGSLLAASSGALVAVQVGLWVARGLSGGIGIPLTGWASLVLTAGVLVLGVVMFVTALAVLAQPHPSSYGRRTSSWAGIGFVAMTGWAVGLPMLFPV